ncbi:hypothetical protein [Streptomyces sp. NBC_00582]|uniref:hypothetical protein n=1 Tax=Streptomyces sp. NBC_00582 TaxID=2975783 RepID=UPI002E7FD949|nr:hypothetical protein [Streptomyces sp. NBC_00582]WUB68451.1 hypothetical protein OG852_50005 [Streptomyces sp. NBC_00582]
MWTQVQINGLDVFTQYPSPFSAGPLQPDVLTGGLDATQVRTRNAHHEAGHAVIGMAEGLPVTLAVLGADSAETPTPPDTYAESGNVSVGPFAVAPLDSMLAFHVAGVRAAHRWLDQEQLLTPATAFLNDVVAGVGDQAKLRSVDAAQPVLFTYGTGRPQQLPDGWDHVELATVYARVDGLVERYWPYIAAVAGHLLAHGRADAEDLAVLFPRAQRPNGRSEPSSSLPPRPSREIPAVNPPRSRATEHSLRA